MAGEFGEFDEDDCGDGPDWYADDDEMCADCQRFGSMMEECCVCGVTMCAACFEMGAGVCKGPHR